MVSKRPDHVENRKDQKKNDQASLAGGPRPEWSGGGEASGVRGSRSPGKLIEDLSIEHSRAGSSTEGIRGAGFESVPTSSTPKVCISNRVFKGLCGSWCGILGIPRASLCYLVSFRPTLCSLNK